MTPPTPEALKAQLAEALGALGHAVTPEGLDDHLSLTADLGVDSFHLTEVARRLERHFGRQLGLSRWVLDESSSAGAGYTVGSLVRYVQGRSPAP